MLEMRLSVWFVVALAAGASRAGSLTPPAGPVTATMKNLAQVEPRTPVQTLPGSASASFVISQSGSYYLTGNIQGVAGLHGIEITTDNVTLDLMGYSIIGAISIGIVDGIHAAGGVDRIHIRGGIVRGWRGNGVEIGAHGASLTDVIVLDNSGDGLSASGFHTIIEDCTSRNNGGNGIRIGAYSRITGCLSLENGGSGIVSSISFCVVDRCVCSENARDGISFGAGSAGTVSNCICISNGQDGISVCGSNLISGNLCTGNGTQSSSGAGIEVRCGNNRVEGNHVVGNDIGIVCSNNNDEVVVRNTAEGNTTANYSVGTGNDVGPIGSAAAATSPWANISH
jgi:parallel beta-helix repeat protein